VSSVILSLEDETHVVAKELQFEYADPRSTSKRELREVAESG